jgi:hypothetical protein
MRVGQNSPQLLQVDRVVAHDVVCGDDDLLTQILADLLIRRRGSSGSRWYIERRILDFPTADLVVGERAVMLRLGFLRAEVQVGVRSLGRLGELRHFKNIDPMLLQQLDAGAVFYEETRPNLFGLHGGVGL